MNAASSCQARQQLLPTASANRKRHDPADVFSGPGICNPTQFVISGAERLPSREERIGGGVEAGVEGDKYVTRMCDEKARCVVIDRPTEADKKILGSPIQTFALGRVALYNVDWPGGLCWPNRRHSQAKR
jgi:hypothetical protein